MKSVTIHPEAEAELEEASDFYEIRRTGLGAEFEAEVQDALDRVALMPSRFPLHGHTGFRKCMVSRFPYTVFFMELDTTIWVAAVAHQRRQPDYWNRRTPN
jgi:toxin ParE1/3/4